jgi:hypothetical protein
MIVVALLGLVFSGGCFYLSAVMLQAVHPAVPLWACMLILLLAIVAMSVFFRVTRRT